MRRLAFSLSFCLVLFAATGFLSSSVKATVMQAATLEELSKESTLVVVGQILDMQSALDNYGRIVTDYQIHCDEIWKGQCDDFVPPNENERGAKSKALVKMRVLGGTIDTLSMVVPGTPHLKKHARAVFFLRKSKLAVGDGVPRLKAVAMSQGVMPITSVLKEGKPSGWTVAPGGAGLMLVPAGQSRAGAAQAQLAAIASNTPLETLKKRVQEILRGSK